MYDEPYRWVEAVGNRRQYLDEQFKHGSPVVALSHADGIVFVTSSRGTPKLYEIYDRIAWGGMGHPADLEKLRFTILEMAHMEGFNRSPADVTVARLMKYGLAPVIKQAFEEVFKAPFIVKILLAELANKPEGDAFLTINYDGTFEETRREAVLAASVDIERSMRTYVSRHGTPSNLQDAFGLALRTWALGSSAQRDAVSDGSTEGTPSTGDAPPDEAALTAQARSALQDNVIECSLLDRHAPGSSKYRPLTTDALAQLALGAA